MVFAGLLARVLLARESVESAALGAVLMGT